MAIGQLVAPAETSPMKKRALAALLWFYSMWYVGAMVASVFGLSPALGPILGAAAAAIIAGDPRRIIWTRPSLNGATTTSGLQNPV
jgi:hypothetical protein